VEHRGVPNDIGDEIARFACAKGRRSQGGIDMLRNAIMAVGCGAAIALSSAACARNAGRLTDGAEARAMLMNVVDEVKVNGRAFRPARWLGGAAGALLTMVADTMIPEAVEGEHGLAGGYFRLAVPRSHGITDPGGRTPVGKDVTDRDSDPDGRLQRAPVRMTQFLDHDELLSMSRQAHR
jgi:hypothetical protein